MKAIKLFKNRRETIFALVFGVIFSFVNLLVKEMQNVLHVETRYVIFVLFNSIILTFFAAELVLQIKYFIFKKSVKSNSVGYEIAKGDAKYYIFVAILIFICWIPVWLAYYPGLFAYDVMSQLPQLDKGYNTYFPVVHTLYLQYFYYKLGKEIIGNCNTGIAIAALLQMLLLAMMISYIHLFLKRCNVTKKIRYFLIVFTALVPIFSILSISMTKDTFFSGFYAMLFTVLCYWEIDAEKASKSIEINIVLFVSLLGTVLFRANGIYAVIPACLVGIFLFFRKSKKFVVLILAATISALAISSGIEMKLDAEKASKSEVLSVPLQQLAFVYKNNFEELTADERKEIALIIPSVDNFNPHNADGVKWTSTAANDMDNFWKVYLKYLKRYPFQYIEEFLHTNAGYLYIFDKTNASIYGYGLESRQGYLLTDTKSGFDITHETKFYALESLLEDLFSANEYQKIFPMFLICSLSLYFWIIVLQYFWVIEYKQWRVMTSMVFVFMLGGTTFLAPAALIRYAFPYILCVPVMITNIAKGDINTNNHNRS